MKGIFRLLDVITLLEDLPESNLQKGQVGTIVEILAKGQAFEVEFSDQQGRTFASLGLRPEQMLLLHFEPVKPNQELDRVLAD